MTDILCPACGHDAEKHDVDHGLSPEDGCRVPLDELDIGGAFCLCRLTETEVLAAECDRLAKMYQREVENAETLRATVGRMAAEEVRWSADRAALGEQMDVLRAEVERLRVLLEKSDMFADGQLVDLNRLRAEVERLTADGERTNG